MSNQLPKRILFVCTANRSRSAMAEFIFRELLRKSRNQAAAKVECRSAGVRAYDDTPADALTFQAMNKRGIDLSGFESSKLTPQLVSEADLVLTMEEAHKHFILHAMPQFASKVFTLKEYVGEKENLDVHDPVGRGVEAFNDTADEIEALLIRLMERLGL